MKKGIVFLIVFLMVISFPICGYAKGKEKIYLDSSWKYADHARIISGYAVMYKAKKNRKDIVIAVNAGHGTKGGHRSKRCVIRMALQSNGRDQRQPDLSKLWLCRMAWHSVTEPRAGCNISYGADSEKETAGRGV